ncbi:MAG: matrixin family metalloprotease [Phycisphaeraceae bacterium]|nr:matrixin family metalloprotease [Phycisphaeraceae bacterium]
MKTRLNARVTLPTLLAAAGVAMGAPPSPAPQADSMLVPVPMLRAQNSLQLSELPALLDDFGPEGAKIETIPLEEIVPAMCFDPDNPPPPEVIAEYNAAMQGYMSRYNINNRWSGTTGSPITLTWSFVPDGLLISAGVSGESPGPSVLFAQMDAKFGGIANRNVWISVFQQSFDRWAQLSGVTYTRVTASGVPWDDGAAWGSFSSSTRGIIRIAGKNIDGASGVLAYNYYPSTTNGIGGDMVMDTSENWGSTTNNYRFMRNVVTHELGHGLGFFHVCPANATKLMEPFLSTAYDGPRHDDLRAVTFNYGDRFEPNNTSGAATVLATTSVGSTISPGTVPTPAIPDGSLLALSNSSDEDWFRSSVTAPRLANIVVSPAGLTYDSSTQNSNGSCNSGNNVNSLNFANLALEVRASDGTTVWRSANATGIGGTETINGVLLSPPGNYFVRVSSTNTFSQSQLYNLTISSVTTPTLTASQGTSTTAVQLAWTAVPSATEYAIFRGTTNSRAAASFLIALAPASTTHNDITAVAGTTYFYWVEAQQGAGGRRPLAGPTSGFRAGSPPVNNNCASAIPLTLGAAYDGSNVNATTQGVASCRPTTSGADVWHTFTPTCTGNYRIDTCGSQFDVVLSVHSACVGTSANTLFCQDDGNLGGTANCPNTLHPAMNVFLESGNTYVIRVAGFGSTPATGAYRILVSSVTPVNDLCANATATIDGTYPVSNCFATTDFQSTNACIPSTQGHNDVWYRYTARCEGNVTIDTCDTNYDTVLMVYPATTCPVAATVPLACNDDTSGCGLGGIRGSRVVFPATPGQQFLVRVAAWATTSRGGGTITFACRPDCSPCAADYNQDGGVDGADVDAFFSDWEQGLPCADVNEDGGIDGSDVDFFFNVWENGGC